MFDEESERTAFWREDNTPIDGVIFPAIQLYCVMRDHEPTVGEVAEVFKLTPERIAEACDYAPWLFIYGAKDEPLARHKIGQDGE
jgi:hypothetical protein